MARQVTSLTTLKLDGVYQVLGWAGLFYAVLCFATKKLVVKLPV